MAVGRPPPIVFAGMWIGLDQNHMAMALQRERKGIFFWALVEGRMMVMPIRQGEFPLTLNTVAGNRV